MKRLSGLVFRYIRQNRHRTVTTLIGTMLSSMIIYIIFACGYSAYAAITQDEYYQALTCWDAMYMCDSRTAQEMVTLAPYYGQTPAVDDSDFKVSHAYFTCHDSTMYVRRFNDFNAMPVPLHMVYGTNPKGENACVISRETARENKMSVGDVYASVVTEIVDEERVDHIYEKLVTGIYSDDIEVTLENENYIPFEPEMVLMKMNDATLQAAENTDSVRVFVTFEDKENIVDQAKALSAAFGGKEYYVNETAIDCFAMYDGNVSVNFLGLQAALLILATTGAIAGLFIVRNAFAISVHDRQSDYGILRCIGMSRRQIIKMIIMEACAIATVGITFGIIIGHGISVAGFWYVKNLLLLPDYFKAQVFGKAVILSIVYAFVTVSYAMVAPVEKIYKLNPIEALRKTTEVKLKKLKAGRGKILTGLFGFEAGYAYKNVLRKKGRFLVMVVSLSIGTMLFVGLSNLFTVARDFCSSMYDVEKADGYFSVNNYEEAQTILNDLDKINAIESYYLYFSTYCAADSDLSDMAYLGVDSALYNKILASAVEKTDRSDSENAVSLIVLNDNIQHPLGDSFTVASGEEVITFEVGAGISPDYYMELVEDYGFPDMSPMIMIYELGNGFNGFETMPADIKFMSTEYQLFIKNPADMDESAFDMYINSSVHYYNGFYNEVKMLVKTMTAVKYIVLVFLVIMLAIFITNVVNMSRAELIVRRDEFQTLRWIGMSYRQESRILYSESFITMGFSWMLGSMLGIIVSWLAALLMMWDMRDALHFQADWLSVGISGVVLLLCSVLTTFLTREEKV